MQPEIHIMKYFLNLYLAIALLGASLGTSAQIHQVYAQLETRSHFDDEAGNNTDVDDPAIWIHPWDASRSLVVGTLKEVGLDVYDLEGKLVQHIPAAPAPSCTETAAACNNKPGRFNNADLVYNYPLGNTKVDLLVASDRGLDRLAIFKFTFDRGGNARLEDISANKRATLFAQDQAAINEGATAYGLTLAYSDSLRAFVSQNNTTHVAVLELYDNGDGKVAYRHQHTLEFPARFALENGQHWTPCTEDDGDLPHFEGLVADADHNRLYLGQEAVGLWRIALDAPADKSRWELFARADHFGIPYARDWDQDEEEYHCTLHAGQDPGYGDSYLRADLEGLTIYQADDGEGYLLVSSQGDNSVAVYERSGNNNYVDSFRVAPGKIDAVDETDGMMVINTALPGFPQGLLVMQDGLNLPLELDAQGQPREGSNFKYVPWGSIAKALNLKIDTRDRSRD